MMLNQLNWRSGNPFGQSTFVVPPAYQRPPGVGPRFDDVQKQLNSYVQQNLLANNTQMSAIYPGPTKPSMSEEPWYKRVWNTYTGALKWEYEMVTGAGTKVWDTVTTPFRTAKETVTGVVTGVNNTVNKITDTLQIGLYAAIAVGGIILIGYARQALK